MMPKLLKLIRKYLPDVTNLRFFNAVALNGILRILYIAEDSSSFVKTMEVCILENGDVKFILALEDSDEAFGYKNEVGNISEVSKTLSKWFSDFSNPFFEELISNRMELLKYFSELRR